MGDALGRSQSAIAHWAKRPDWPFGRPIRWPLKISDVRGWVDATLTKDASDVGIEPASIETDDELRAAVRRDIAGLDPLKKARLRKLLAETDQIKRKNKILDELYIERAKARAEISANIHNTKTAMLAETRSSIDALDSLGFIVDGTKKQAAKVLRERFEALCHRYADSMNDVTDRQS